MRVSDAVTERIQRKKPFYSLEFFPPKDRALWPSFLDTVEQLKAMDPLFVSVTYGAGGSTRDNTLDLTAAIAQKGLTPMAHLTCVGADAASLRDFLNGLRAAGVHNVLALRGDLPKDRPATDAFGEFVHAVDLVRFVRREFPDFSIGVSAYPHPHPESPSFASDRQATAEKIAAGADFAVTQLFFDHREYVAYVEAMRALGATVPILPGVLPVQSLESLKRILFLSGCNIPAKLFLTLEEAHAKGGAEAVREAGIAFAVEQTRRLLDCGAPGVHLYTLNKADVCLRIASEIGPL
jgi:methylenetetrahydrofolate reductase (NADPH)